MLTATPNGWTVKTCTPSLAVVILAGGRSSRMGTDKSKLVLPSGRTLLEHAQHQALMLLRALQKPEGHVLVSGPVPGGVADIIPGRGPLSGLHSAMSTALVSQMDWLMVLPVDMPRIAVPTLLMLAHAAFRSSQPAVHFPDRELPVAVRVHHDLCSNLATRLLREGPSPRTRSLGDFLQSVGAEGAQPPEETEAEFANVNRPEDFAEFCSGETIT